MQFKQAAEERHKNIGNLEASGADLEKKITELSAKKTTLLAELKEVEAAWIKLHKRRTNCPMLSRPFRKTGTLGLARRWH